MYASCSSSVLSIILYKTRFGLRLRACGENPQAADSLGINVYKMRYAGTTISGALAGMGGFVYALTTAELHRPTATWRASASWRSRS